MRLSLLLLALTCFLASFGLASAQTCLDELSTDLDSEQLSQEATGLDAARFLKRAVDLLEPVLPQLVNTPDYFPLVYNDVGFDEAQFLAQRGLLPASWQVDELSQETWQDMVSRVASWYELGFVVSSDLTREALLADLSKLIVQASSDLRPVALIATDAADGQIIDFWAIIRNQSVFPRLIVMRPPGTDVRFQSGVRSALPLIETCALKLEKFIHASSDTATRLFEQNFDRVDMYVASTAPLRMDGFSLVPPGQETDYFTFKSDALSQFDTYAAAFYGPGVGARAVLRLLPQVRTNMNPREIMQFVLP